jgi:ATP-binding cassette, subfamily B, bacterial MsbA
VGKNPYLHAFRNEPTQPTSAKLVLQRIYPLMLPHWRKFAFAIVCMLGSSGFMALTAYLIKPAIDDIFLNKNLFMLKLIPFLFIAVSLGNGLCHLGSDYLLKSVGLSIVSYLREKLYNHVQDMPLSFFDRMPTGALMSRITNDVNEIHGAVSGGLTGLLKDIFTVIALVCVVFYQDWRLTLVATISMPLFVFPIYKFGSKIRKLAIQRQKSMAKLHIILHETLTGARIVKAFGMENYEKKRFSDSNQKVLSYRLKSEWLDSLSSPMMEFIGSLGIAATIGYGGYQVIQGVSTPGTFFSFLGAVLMLYKPVKNLSKGNNIFQKAIASTQRIYVILDEKNPVVELPGATDLPPIRQGMEFRDVSFSYQNKVVLHDINLQVRAGEVIALVGSSGAGKTTLINLIPRFYDVSSGAILIDDQDIREVTVKSLRSQISVVTQQSFLFNDTVRNNIAYGNLSKEEKDIEAAARAAYAYDFIMDLSEGFDTLIGEQGVRLSGGQRQRICIARALLKDTPILILDEATSSLDSESELEVQMALENLMQGRTTFVIAHRLSTIQSADRILVLSNGRIIEEGTHLHLLDHEGEYRRLFDLQFQRGASRVSAKF